MHAWKPRAKEAHSESKIQKCITMGYRKTCRARNAAEYTRACPRGTRWQGRRRRRDRSGVWAGQTGAGDTHPSLTSQNLAPIWLPHWPAWMWTISRMMSFVQQFDCKQTRRGDEVAAGRCKGEGRREAVGEDENACVLVHRRALAMQAQKQPINARRLRQTGHSTDEPHDGASLEHNHDRRSRAKRHGRERRRRRKALQGVATGRRGQPATLACHRVSHNHSAPARKKLGYHIVYTAPHHPTKPRRRRRTPGMRAHLTKKRNATKCVRSAAPN